MKEGKLIRVFIASPGDVKEEREMLFKVIEELNKPKSPLKKRGCTLKALGWEDVPPGMKRPEQTILDHYPVHSWDIFIGILWGRFGTPPGERDQKTGFDYESGTEEEFDRSYDYWKKTKRPRIMVYRCMRELQSGKVDGDQLEKVKAFFKEFECAGRYPGLYQKYGTVDQLRERVKLDLEYVVINLMIPFMPPSPPKNFIDRHDIVEQLKERLFKGKDIGIHGLPGVGKTAVALAILNDSQVREHFNGGILWAPLGRDPDVLAVLGECAAALGISLNEIADAKTVEARKTVILKSIGEKPILMVIDDARRDSEAESLKIDCAQCDHILTSPNLHVASAFANGEQTAMSGLDEKEGLKLLGIHVPNVVENKPEDAKRLVNAVSGLPQALIMVGERLRKKTAGLPPGFLKNELNELLAQGKLPLDVVIKDSYDDLDNDAKVILQYLSIFPQEPNSFSEDAALAVSGKTNDEIECLRSLFEFKFLEFKEDENSCRYMLSNAISNFAIGKCTDEAAKTAKQRMVNFYVNYVKEHEEENALLEWESSNILTALQAAYDLGMKEDLLKGVNAFFHYMETNGLYELAEKQLKLAEKAGRYLGDEKELAATLLHLGDVAYIHSNYKDAEKYYNESLGLPGKVKDRTVIIDSLKGLGDVAGVHGGFAMQKEHYKKALENARETDPDNKGEIIDLLTRLGRMEDIKGNYDKAKKYFHEAMIINAGDNKLINSKLYAEIGWVDAHLGDFDQAKKHWEKGLELAMEINHKGNIGFLYSNLGWVEDRWGNFKQAEKHFETGLKIAREIGYLNMIGVILTNMGAAKIHRGDYENAKKDLKEGLDIVEKSGHVERKGVLLENLAIASCRLGNNEEAKKYLEEGMQVAQKGIIERVSALHTYLGELALSQGDYIVAEKELLVGLKQAKKIKNPERLGLVYKDLGVLADRQGNPEKAEPYLNEALNQAKEINYQWLLSSIYIALGEHWYTKKDYRNARRDFKEAQKISTKIKSRDMIAAAQDGLKRLERIDAA
jgi:tetratricopeptide (TPR) repeat protein